MKKTYLYYVLVFIVGTFVIYHLTYFFLWLSNMPTEGYALLLSLVFLFVSIGLCRRFRNTNMKAWICIFIGSWLFGSVYALGPSTLKSHRYGEGLIIRCTDITSIFRDNLRNGLVDKWGRTVLDSRDNEYCYISPNLIVGLDFIRDVEDKWEVDIHVYENYKLTNTTKCIADYNSGSSNTIYDYIEQNYGRPIYSYNHCRHVDDSSIRFDLSWEILEIIENSNEGDGSLPR